MGCKDVGCTPDGGWTRPAVVVHEGQYYYKNSEKVTDEPMSTEAHLSNRFEDDLKAGIYVASGDFETEEDIKNKIIVMTVVGGMRQVMCLNLMNLLTHSETLGIKEIKSSKR